MAVCERVVWIARQDSEPSLVSQTGPTLVEGGSSPVAGSPGNPGAYVVRVLLSPFGEPIMGLACWLTGPLFSPAPGTVP